MAARGGKQLKQIKEGGRKLSNMERTMSSMLHQFEEEKDSIREGAAGDNAAALAEADGLRRALALKSKELEHVRRLGREVLAQRSMCERFLIDSINIVRREVAEDQRLRLPSLAPSAVNNLSRGALGSALPEPVSGQPQLPCPADKMRCLIHARAPAPCPDMGPAASPSSAALRWGRAAGVGDGLQPRPRGLEGGGRLGGGWGQAREPAAPVQRGDRGGPPGPRVGCIQRRGARAAGWHGGNCPAQPTGPPPAPAKRRAAARLLLTVSGCSAGTPTERGREARRPRQRRAQWQRWGGQRGGGWRGGH